MKSLSRLFFSMFFIIALSKPNLTRAEDFSSLDDEASGEVSYFDSETAASISAAVPVALLAGAGILVACSNSSSSSSSHVHAHTH